MRELEPHQGPASPDFGEMIGRVTAHGTRVTAHVNRVRRLLEMVHSSAATNSVQLGTSGLGVRR
jgi:hypothetical protein